MTKSQAAVFFGIICLGAVISVVSLVVLDGDKDVVLPNTGSVPAMEEEAAATVPKPEPEEKPDMTSPAAPATAPAAEAPPAVMAEKEGVVTGPAPDMPEVAVFNSPAELMKALTGAVQARDMDAVAGIAGDEALSDENRNRVGSLLQDETLTPAPADSPRQVAKVAGGERWVISLVAAEGAMGAELYADLSKDAEAGWGVAKLFPQRVNEMKVAVTSEDALMVAHQFVKSVIERDFDQAREFVNPNKVTDERIAALFIAMEEGGFALRSENPLVQTLDQDELAWVIARVQSTQEASEFGLTLDRAAQEKWMVSELTFSKLLNTLAMQGGAGGVAYSPIITNPQAGDLLVLYFEFNEDQLTARALKQLKIISDILKKSPVRKITIDGYTDAIGSDSYNLGLSSNRSVAVKEALLNMGVPPEQILTRGLGEANPISPNENPDGTDNPQGRSQNRRAEVYLDL